MVDGECLQADTKAKLAHTVALENKVNTATAEIQNMISIVQSIAEVVQAMQSMMITNASVGLVTPRPVIKERPKKWS